MNKAKLASILLATLFVSAGVGAAPKLIAIGSLSGNAEDRSNRTSYVLENGVAGNLLGGLGSGIGYAGCNNFVAVPDRGPNAKPYNDNVDNTASYINRFHSLRLALSPATAGSPLPFDLAVKLKKTTLLSSATPLVYGTGAGLGVGSGIPPLNNKAINYFTGRSDNFDATQISTDPNNARFDPESIRVSNDGKSVFISDEYGPYVYQFNRDTGRREHAFALPAHLAVTHLNAVGNTEIGGNTSGRVANKGMEGLAITPDGSTLVGALQSPLIQDGGTNAAYLRIVRIDVVSGATHEYAYPLTNIGTASKPKYGTVSDIVAINDHEFLVDERDGKGLGDDSVAVFKRLYRIDLTGATDVSGFQGEAALKPFAVSKALFLDVFAALNAFGIAATDIPAKLEGVAFGPDVVVNGTTTHTLVITNDNDFVGTVVDTNHPAGVDNPNKFFIFAVASSDLPTFVPQALESNGSCAEDDDDD